MFNLIYRFDPTQAVAIVPNGYGAFAARVVGSGCIHSLLQTGERPAS